ncbi:Immunoglobulin superfamily member 3 [Labeo rohita]|nr:Immunoglobulin superfamily member 3 [Labeo rohita]
MAKSSSLSLFLADRDFSIQVTTERRAYTAGEPLELRCTIDAQNVPERFFSVSWVFSSSPVAVIGPSAVPMLGPNYVEREATGLLTVRKESPSVHLLKLQRLLPEDSGKYICRVTEREKTLTGDFIDRSKRSRNVQITVTPLRSNITVSLSSNTSEIMEGETIQLTCVVSNTVGPLSVTWQWTDKEGAGPAVNVATVDREGTVTPGPTFRERSSFGEVRMERVRPDTFTLFLYNAFPTDEGQYRCSATEWSQSGAAPDWTWQQIGDESASKTVTLWLSGSAWTRSSQTSAHAALPPTSSGVVIVPLIIDYVSKTMQWVTQGNNGPCGTAEIWAKFVPGGCCVNLPSVTAQWRGIIRALAESFFFVSASSRTPSVTFGDSFDLQCIVKPRHNPNVPAAVTWRFQPAEGDGEFRNLVTFTRDGTLQWGDQLLGLGTRTTVDRTPTNTNFRLSITRAGRKEAGTYQCAALLYRKNYDGTWSTVANRTSNPLGISVLQPGEFKNGFRRRKAEAGTPNGLECMRKRLLISSTPEKVIRREEYEEGNDGGGETISLELIGMETHSCLARVELWSLYSPLRPAGDAVILHLRYLFCAFVCNCCLTRCGAEPLSKNQCDDLAGANGCETTLGGKHALLSPAGLLPALWLHANQCSPPETCL